MDQIGIDAPAKINLALHVTGQRPDGYHLIESLVTFATIGDRLTVRRAGHDSFHLTGRFSRGLPTDQDNLVLRARDALRNACPAASQPVAITLEKRLPVASGIGGGSSDAAALLRAMDRLLKLRCLPRQMQSIALGLGADVPMCLDPRPLIARGIGEVLEPVRLPALPIVLANAGLAVGTPGVFKGLASKVNPSLPRLEAKDSVEDVAEWLRGSRNDLQPPAMAMEPAIGVAIEEIEAQAPLLARMSGSGATCFGIFRTMDEAGRAAQAIRALHPDWFVEAAMTIEGGGSDD